MTPGSTALVNAMVPATVGVGSGMPLEDAAAEGDAASTPGDGVGVLDDVASQPPQAARASSATKTSSANALATIVRDPRSPWVPMT